ncbi:MAG: SDR family oxidoreductase [Acidimicrobiales bacterium]|jgi:NAD(P)-dependent dehydrogenase (short-subunit alcohol dehydrogenase family)
MFEVRGAVCVVTGASSGLGRRFALDLAGRGAVVVGLARRRDLLVTLATELQRSSPDSSTVPCDVGDTDGFVAALSEVERHHGRIDVLVNNAGTGPPRGTAEPGVDVHRAVMATNYFGPVAGTLAVVPGMRERGRGVVVNVSSDSGRAPGPHEAAYGASKAALSAFTESLAFDTEDTGVHLHVLYPGWVPTAMGRAAVDDGMPMPPRMVRRTEEQVSRLVLERMGGPRIDIDAAVIARMAPVGRALFPRAYRKGVRKAGG